MRRGRNRIDARSKGILNGVRHSIRRYRAKFVNANDNFAVVAANDNVDGAVALAA